MRKHLQHCPFPGSSGSEGGKQSQGAIPHCGAGRHGGDGGNQLLGSWGAQQYWVPTLGLRGRGQAWPGGEGWRLAYPDSTPRTRLRTKKDPMMMRGMKYNQFQVAPKASLVWRGKEKTRVTLCSTPVPGAEGGCISSGAVAILPPG